MAQVKKQFSIDHIENVEKVDLNFNSTSGTCYIRPHQNTDLLNVYGNREFETYASSFNKNIQGKVCSVNLSLEDDNSNGESRSISYSMFGNSSD